MPPLNCMLPIDVLVHTTHNYNNIIDSARFYATTNSEVSRTSFHYYKSFLIIKKAMCKYARRRFVWNLARTLQEVRDELYLYIPPASSKYSVMVESVTSLFIDNTYYAWNFRETYYFKRKRMQ